jgi:ribosomal protein S5
MGWNPWGSPLIGCMLSLAGIRDVSFKVIAGTIDPYAMTYAFFKAMTKN